MDSLWLPLFLSGYVLTLLLMPGSLLSRRKHRASTLAWIFAIVVLPFLGPLLYAVFGMDGVRRRQRERQRMLEQIMPALASLSEFEAAPQGERSEAERRLKILATRLTRMNLTTGNAVELIADTPRAFQAMEEAIRAARNSVHVQFYIWRADDLGIRIRDLLIETARRGVEVRFIYDGIGSMLLGRRFLRPMREAGIEVNPSLPGSHIRERWSINLRNHRKSLIVDGSIGFTGGLNVETSTSAAARAMASGGTRWFACAVRWSCNFSMPSPRIGTSLPERTSPGLSCFLARSRRERRRPSSCQEAPIAIRTCSRPCCSPR